MMLDPATKLLRRRPQLHGVNRIRPLHHHVLEEFAAERAIRTTAPHGNAAAYYYTKEDQNYYGADGGTTPVKYDRGAMLDHIDYGLREVNGSIQANKATNNQSAHRVSIAAPICLRPNIT